jgi:hypothetical protein
MELIARKMLLQFALKDIGQLTDLFTPARETARLTADRQVRAPGRSGENTGAVHYREAAGMRHYPGMRTGTLS